MAHTEAFLTITKVKEQAPTKEPPSIVDSMKTLTRLQNSSSAPVDPWIQSDPWKRPLNRLAARFAEQIQEQVKSIALTGDDEMEDVSSQRLDRVESALAELRAQNGKFHAWCQDAGGKMTLLNQRITQQDNAIASLQTQVHANQQATDQLGQTVVVVRTEIRQDLGEAMDKQTKQLDALLVKRLKSDR